MIETLRYPTRRVAVVRRGEVWEERVLVRCWESLASQIGEGSTISGRASPMPTLPLLPFLLSRSQAFENLSAEHFVPIDTASLSQPAASHVLCTTGCSVAGNN